MPNQSFLAMIARLTFALGPLAVIVSVATITLPPTQESLPSSYKIQPVVLEPERESGLQPTDRSDHPIEQADRQVEHGIQECTILLISGRRITGELIRQDSLIVVIGIDGIETTFQRNNIASVTLLPSVEDRYTEMRASIPDDDIEARLTLIEWLRARRAYTLAIRELESVLIDDPNNPRAKLLHTWLTEYDKLGSTKPRDGSKDSSPRDADKLPKNRKQLRNSIKPLTPEQVNLMRVYEIDLRDPPKLKVPDAALEELMRRKPDAFSPNESERRAIFKLSEIDKLRLIFTHKARDLYSQVNILEDPASLEAFKKNVHSQRGWVINACATTRCHGGIDAGRFQLMNSKPNSTETVYTNFFIIENYTLANGSPLINYEDPERSPLLQMGMVEKNSLTPHPEIPKDFPGTGFRPIFRSTRDRKYRDAIEWIRSMYQPRPEYGFEDRIQPKPDQIPAPAPDHTDP